MNRQAGTIRRLGSWRSALSFALLVSGLNLPDTAAACSWLSVSVASSDRVLSFLPSSGNFADKARVNTGAPLEGMVVFDRDLNSLRYCDGTAWKTVSFKPASDEAAPALVAGWGWNNNEQLGNPEIPGNRSLPDRLSPGDFATAKWSEISTGTSYSCAIRNPDRRMFCWGLGTSGQLGNNSTTSRNLPSPLSLVYSATSWLSVSAGHSHTCAIRRSDRTLFCWGSNSYGQLGRGTTTTQENAPASLSPTNGWQTKGWKSVRAGLHHTCALDLENKIYCWGRNDSGQLGISDLSTLQSSLPLAINSPETWKALSSKGSSNCALRNPDGRVFCWGANGSGQLGNGTNGLSESPTGLASSGGWNQMTWKNVMTGGSHTCAIRSDDRLFCWGNNSSGQLGIGGTTPGSSPEPLALTASGGFDTTTWKEIAAGDLHTCALRSDDELFCWGGNGGYQLGTGNTSSLSAPTQINTGTQWILISTGSNHSCGIRLADRQIRCWGQNSSGQTGTGNNSDTTTPAFLKATGRWDDTAWLTVSAGGSHSCGIKDSDRKIYCWGDNSHGQLGTGTTVSQASPTAVNSSSLWRMVSAGENHTCAIDSNNALYCWGQGSDGKLGLGSISNALSPSAVGPTTNFWSTVSAGKFHTCAIRSTGSLFCWGDNTYGQLGNSGTAPATYSPTAVNTGTNSSTWKAVSVGNYHSCAIDSTDKINCWGLNSSGQLGNDTTTASTNPSALSPSGDFREITWKSVSAKGLHTCAIRFSNDRIYCWGNNSSSQLGNGLPDNQTKPTPLSALGNFDGTTWKSVSAGHDHTCAIRLSDGQLHCWGSNSYGQIGNGNLTTQSTPVPLRKPWDLTAWKEISSGSGHTLALEDSSNFKTARNRAPGLGDFDLGLKFPNFSDLGISGQTSWMESFSTGDTEGILAYDSTNSRLLLSNGARWMTADSVLSGNSCSNYPIVTDYRVIELRADAANKTYNTHRANRPTPRAGSLIYNSTAKALQFCDGTNWRNLIPSVSVFQTSGTWTVPAGVTSITVETWGGGGGGKANTGLTTEAGGGGGGSYSIYTNLAVTPGETLSVTVGSGGTPDNSGGASSVSRGNTVLVTAPGGLAGSTAMTSYPATPAAGTYTTTYKGGRGAGPSTGGGTRAGGGGGGGAGPLGNGGDGTTGTYSGTPSFGGAGKTTSQGSGGDGGFPTNGLGGSFPGGGGGGKGNANGTWTSGSGAPGLVRITIP